MRVRSIRAQSAVAAAVVVGAGLAVGGLVVVLVLQALLVSSLQDTLTTRLAGLVQQLQAEGDPAVLAETSVTADGSVVLLYGPQGQLVYRSPTPRGAPDLSRVSVDLPPVTAAAGEVVLTGRSALPTPAGLRDPLVAAQSVLVGGRSDVLAVAGSQDTLEDAVSTAGLVLAVAWPFLIALAAWTVWWRVGRALARAEDIRRRVEHIDAAHLDERLPDPGSGDEIAALAQTMNGMLSRVHRSQQAQRQFVADASHELRSPVATLVAVSELMAGSPTAEWAEVTPLVGSEAHRLSALVDSLLVLSRVDADALAMSVQEVDLDDVVTAEVTRLRAVTRHQVTASVAPVRLRGDPLRLAQTVRNLLDNADRHAHSRVDVTLSATDVGVVSITVDDDGTGIPAADRERVFDRFVRLDDSRARDRGGFGLGLPIARAVVQAHRGTLQAGVAPAGGARLTITLPVPDS